MNPDLPHHLHETRDLLMGSLRCHPVEKAPEVPRALLEDLTRSVAITPEAAPRRTLADLLESLRFMIASPAFGSAAAAVMILGIAATVVLRPDAGANKDGYRGAGDYAAADAIQIFMIDAPAGFQGQLESDFEDGIFSSADSTEDARKLNGAKVIVDFSAKTITAFNVKGLQVYRDVLPESSTGITLSISSAVTRL